MEEYLTNKNKGQLPLQNQQKTTRSGERPIIRSILPAGAIS